MPQFLSLCLLFAAVIISYVYPSLVLASGKCSELPGKLCSYYETNKDKAFFELPDGTFQLNANHFKSDNNPGERPSFSKYETMAKLMDIIDVPGLSAHAKLDIARMADQLFGTAPATNPGTDTGNGKLQIYWPLSGAAEKLQQVDRSAILSSLEQIIGVEKFTNLKNFVLPKMAEIKAYDDALDAQNGGKQEFLKITEAFNNPALVQTRTARLQELYNFSKRSVIDTITKGVTDSKLWTAEQKNLVTRVNSVKMELISPTDKEKMVNCQSISNAVYIMSRNSFTMCPGLLTLPDAQVVKTIAHELGHSVDPCNSSSDFGKMDVEKLKAFLQTDQFNASNRQNLKQQMDDGNLYMSPELLSFISDPQAVEKLTAAGVFKAEVPGIKSLPQLYASNYSCLVREYGFRAPEPGDGAKQLREFSSQLDNYSDFTPAQKTEALSHMEYMNRSFPQCDFFSGPQTQMQEVMADVFGDLAKDKFLKKNPPKNELETMLSMNSTQICDYKKLLPSVPGYNVNFMGQLTSKPNFTRTFNDSHPSDVKRAVLEADTPDLATIYGCERAPVHCIDNLRVITGSSADTTNGVEQ